MGVNEEDFKYMNQSKRMLVKSLSFKTCQLLEMIRVNDSSKKL